MGALGWPHIVAILVIVLLVFGASRLPALARSLGQSTKILKDELKDGSKGDSKAGTVESGGDPAAKTEPTASSSAPDTRSS